MVGSISVEGRAWERTSRAWGYTLLRELFPVAKVHTFVVDNSSKHQIVRNQIDGWNEGEKDIPSPRHDGGAEKTQLCACRNQWKEIGSTIRRLENYSDESSSRSSYVGHASKETTPLGNDDVHGGVPMIAGIRLAFQVKTDLKRIVSYEAKV